MGVDVHPAGQVTALADDQAARAVDEAERAYPGPQADIRLPDEPRQRIVRVGPGGRRRPWLAGRGMIGRPWLACRCLADRCLADRCLAGRCMSGRVRRQLSSPASLRWSTTEASPSGSPTMGSHPRTSRIRSMAASRWATRTSRGRNCGRVSTPSALIR